MKKLLVLFIGAIILFSPEKVFADESSMEERALKAEKLVLDAESIHRALKAENKMLQIYIKNLKNKIAKMSIEIRRLKSLPISDETAQSQPVDSNSNKVKTDINISAQPTLEKSDAFIKALLKYSKTDKTTTAKRQEARKSFSKEGSAPISIDFEVNDISIVDDNTANVVITNLGTVKTIVKVSRPIQLYSRVTTFKIKMSRSLTSKIEKGHKFVISGVVDMSSSLFSRQSGTFLLRYTFDMNISIRNMVITLNGQRVKLVK